MWKCGICTGDAGENVLLRVVHETRNTEHLHSNNEII